MKFVNSFFRKSSPLQTDRVQSVGVRASLGRGLREREHIARYSRASADKRMRPNADEVMHRTQRSHGRPISYGDVSAQRGRVRHDDVVSNLAVMRNVGVSHDEVIVADPRTTSALHSATVDGHKFADFIVISNF